MRRRRRRAVGKRPRGRDLAHAIAGTPPWLGLPHVSAR
jgi:hypothetical protein